MEKLLTIGITTHNSHLFVSELLFTLKQNFELGELHPMQISGKTNSFSEFKAPNIYVL